MAIVVLAGIGVYGLLAGRPKPDTPGGDSGTRPGPVVTSPGEPGPTGTPTLPALPEVEASDDPETFAGNVAERFYRDVRLFRLYEGTSQIHVLNIAKQMLARAGR